MAKPTVRVNGLTMAHKGTGGYVVSTLPDVCLTPPKPVPVPYTNVSYITTLQKGTQTVHADGGNMIAIKGSEQATSVGDEPGTAGGVKSGVNMHRATWLSWSPDVYMEGRPVCRLTDKMLMNKSNTVSIGGHWDPPIAGKHPGFEEELREICEEACATADSEETAKQNDWADKIRKKGYNPNGGYNYPTPETMQNGTLPEVNMQKMDGKYRIVESGAPERTGLPSRRPVMPNSIRPDAVIMKDGEVKKIVEMKFGKDTPSDNQLRKYPRAAQDHSLDRQDDLIWLDVEEDCDCAAWRQAQEEEEEQEAESPLPMIDPAAERAKAMTVMRLLAKNSPLGRISELGKLLLPTPAY